MDGNDCTFCEVIAGSLPSRKRFEDDDVVVFDNELDWLPVMLLVVPRTHMTQVEIWKDSAMLSKLGSLAVRLGQEHCPGGFRVLSNFGDDALQTQRHGHLHVLGGQPMGLYVRPPQDRSRPAPPTRP